MDPSGMDNMSFGYLLTILALPMTMCSLGILILVCTILKRFQN